MTIELGFVFLDDPAYPKQIVFIDVPGHEKFVKTMAAGASNVDAALLVVAADEGIAVQTREHFDILTLLGIELGAVVLTKRDLVDDARLAELTASVRRFVRGSFLDGAPVLPVSALTGAGIPDLKALLQDIGRRVRPRPDSGVFRMPVDRVFTMHGFGTVVAGTVLSGSVRAGDRIEIYPEGLKTRVRGLQVHKSKADSSGIGKRTALNLQDLAKEDLRRGQVAAAEGSLVPTSRLDARLDVLAGAPREIKHRDRVRLHIGTDEVMARLSVIGGPTIAPGASSPVQLVLERPAVALPGDRFVIRSFSPIVTVGGGRVLDAAPEKHKRLSGRVLQGLEKLGGTARDAVEQMFAQSTAAPRTVAEIARKLGRAESEAAETIAALLAEGALVAVGTEKPARYLHRSVRDALADGLVEGLEAYFTANPFKAEMPFSDVRAAFLEKSDAAAFKHVLDSLIANGVLYRKDAGIGLAAGRSGSIRSKPIAGPASRTPSSAARFSAPLEDDVRARLGLNPFGLPARPELAPARRYARPSGPQGDLSPRHARSGPARGRRPHRAPRLGLHRRAQGPPRPLPQVRPGHPGVLRPDRLHEARRRPARPGVTPCPRRRYTSIMGPSMKSELALVLFHLRVGARLALRVLAPVLAACLFLYYILRPEFTLELARILFVEASLLEAGLAGTLLLVGLARIVAPRIAAGSGGWARSLPADSGTRRLSAVLSMLIAEAPLLALLGALAWAVTDPGPMHGASYIVRFAEHVVRRCTAHRRPRPRSDGGRPGPSAAAALSPDEGPPARRLLICPSAATRPSWAYPAFSWPSLRRSP